LEEGRTMTKRVNMYRPQMREAERSLN
jgi:hypothetical protein